MKPYGKPARIVALTADWWDQQYLARRAQGWTIWKDRRLIDHVARGVAYLRPDARILFLASGAAAGVDALRERFKGHEKYDTLRWHLQDYSALALTEAFQRIGQPAVPATTLSNLDDVRWPFPDGSFDMVICSEVLEHLENPTSAILECRRIVKSNGLIVATFPIHPELLADHHRWIFEPKDAWDLFNVGAGQKPRPNSMKVHHLREGKLIVAIARL